MNESCCLRGPRSRRGFTLIELLVVIAIIAALIGMLIPAVQKVRDSSMRTQCANNMKQLGLAMHSLYDGQKSFPPSRTTVPPIHSWSAFILPYIEQSAAFNQYNMLKDWNDPANYNAIRTPLAVFTCPAVPSAGARFDDSISAAPACGDYGCISAVHPEVMINCCGITNIVDENNDRRVVGALQKDKKTRFRDIVDGTSNTILIAEDAGRPTHFDKSRKPMQPGLPGADPKEGGWADPGANFSIDGANDNGTVNGPCAMNCSNNSEVYSFHNAGANFVFVDGSVRFLMPDWDTVNSQKNVCVLAALVTRSGPTSERPLMALYVP